MEQTIIHLLKMKLLTHIFKLIKNYGIVQEMKFGNSFWNLQKRDSTTNLFSEG